MLLTLSIPAGITAMSLLALGILTRPARSGPRSDSACRGVRAYARLANGAAIALAGREASGLIGIAGAIFVVAALTSALVVSLRCHARVHRRSRGWKLDRGDRTAAARLVAERAAVIPARLGSVPVPAPSTSNSIASQIASALRMGTSEILDHSFKGTIHLHDQNMAPATDSAQRNRALTLVRLRGQNSPMPTKIRVNHETTTTRSAKWSR
jgi:hypothetical protein